MISTVLKQSKKNYNDMYFKDISITWKIPGKGSIPKIFSLKDHTVTDPQTTANTFNSSFCFVAAEVQSEVPFSYIKVFMNNYHHLTKTRFHLTLYKRRNNQDNSKL